MVVLELSEHLAHAGAQVTIYTNFCDSPIKKEFSRLKNVQVITEEPSAYDDFNLIWIHHQLIPVALLRYLERCDADKRPQIVFHHMSPFHPLEFPFAIRLEAEMADLILYNSEETRQTIENKLPSRIAELGYVFQNPAPESFMNPRKHMNKLKRLLVVSNHVPPEVADAVTDMKSQGIEVALFGLNKDEFKRVTVEDIQKYDAVMSIGKTVQYSILAETPVYIYDHFGGPGYLTKSNFETAKHFNFSGRGFEGGKSAQVIRRELVDGYKAAVKDIKWIAKNESGIFRLGYQLDAVRSLLGESPARHKPLEPMDVQAYTNYHTFTMQLHKQARETFRDMISLRDQLNDKSRQIEQLNGKINQLRDLNLELGSSIQDAERILGDVYLSASWKVTKPFRNINALLVRIQNATKSSRYY